MVLIDLRRSGGERTRHIGIRYFWVKELVDTGEVRVVHKGTEVCEHGHKAATGNAIYLRERKPDRIEVCPLGIYEKKLEIYLHFWGQSFFIRLACIFIRIISA